MGAVFALYSAWYFWIPKILGLDYNKSGGITHFWTLFIGVNVTFFPQHFLGLQGMPRRISDYPDSFTGWNLVSSLGSLISVIATYIFLYVLYIQLIKGKESYRYSWLSPQFYSDSLRSLLERAYESIEWGLNSPPKPHSFVSLPAQSFSVTPLLLLLSDPNDQDNQGDQQDQQDQEDLVEIFDTPEKDDLLATALTDYLFFTRAVSEWAENGDPSAILSRENPAGYDSELARTKQEIYGCHDQQKLDMVHMLHRGSEAVESAINDLIGSGDSTEPIEPNDNSPNPLSMDAYPSGPAQDQNASSQPDDMDLDSPSNDAGSENEVPESSDSGYNPDLTALDLDGTNVGRVSESMDALFDFLDNFN